MPHKVTLLSQGSGIAIALFGAVAMGLCGCAHHDSTNYSDSRSFPITNTPSPGYRIFHLAVAGGVIDLETPVSGLQATDAELQTWVLDAARAVGTYFGHFPIPRVHIIIAAGGHGDDPEGVTTDDDITVRIRSDFGKADMKRDWVMTHEMFHLAFPDMDDQYIWIREGLASYLEPLARSRVGQLSSEQVWSEWVEGMPQGQPEPGDMGLNHTHTWGRTYWGGSIFCLLADLRIREQTQNHRSLDDAMRAILTHGGNRLAHWPMDKVISIGDEATGTNVLRDLYKEMADRPVTVELNALWKRLGIELHRRRVTFDDTAPLATIRISMTAAPVK